MKKKIFSVFLAAAMAVFMLAGCGGNDGTASTGGKVSAEEEDAKDESTASADSDRYAEGMKVGFTCPSVGNDFLVALTGAIQQAMEDVGCDVQLDSAEGDVTKQISQIENYVSMGCDVIVVWAVNSDGVANAVQQAVNAGVPVLAFAYAVDTASCSMVSADDTDMGNAVAEMASDWINETFPDAGDGEINVLAVTASNTPESVVKSDAMLILPDINSKVTLTTVEVEDQDSMDSSRTLIENTLMANPDYNVILAMNNTIALGAESYVMSADYGLEDPSQFGIFNIDETDEIDAKLLASKTNESVIRGCVSMGVISNTVKDFMTGMEPLLKGGEPKDVHGSATKITAADLQ